MIYQIYNYYWINNTIIKNISNFFLDSDAKNQTDRQEKLLNLMKSQPRNKSSTFGDGSIHKKASMSLPPLLPTRNVNSIQPNLAGLR